MPLEFVREGAKHIIESISNIGIAFWYMAIKNGESYWSTPMGKLLLAILPGIITAILTAAVTVGSIYLSMREGMLNLQSGLAQVQMEHKVFYSQQESQDHRINETEKDVANIKGVLYGGAGAGGNGGAGAGVGSRKR